MATPYREAALEELRSIWYRNPSSFQFPATMSGTERQHAQHEAKLGLGGVLGAVRRFAARSGPGGVVTKMFGASAICEQGGRRVALTQRLTDTDLDDLRGVELTTTP